MVACGAVFERFKLPQAAVVIFVGVLLGPAGIGVIKLGDLEHTLSELAVIIMLFSAGYNIQWSHFTAAIKPGIGVGLWGIVTSLVAGSAAAYFLSKDIDEALYVGIALSATSIGLSVALMSHASVLESRVGQILLAAAIVDDILVMYLLSVTHASLINDGGVSVILSSLLLNLLVLSGLSGILCVFNALIKHFSVDQSIVFRRSMAIAMALLSAWVTARFGLSPVVGGFVAGAVVAGFKDQSVGGGINGNTSDSGYFAGISQFLSPMFFLAIGLEITDINLQDEGLLHYALWVFTAAVIGKLLAPWVLAGVMTVRECLLLGFALLPRAEVALVVASVGLQQGHLSHHGMIALVLMTLATATIAATVIPPLARLAESGGNR